MPSIATSAGATTRARFDQVYGEGAGDWEIQVGRGLPGQDRMAAAWPAGLHTELQAHRQVRSVRVALLDHLGVLLAHEPQFSGCIAEVEADGAGFLMLVRGVARRVRWCRFDHPDGLLTAVRTEWANVLAGGEPLDPAGLALALLPPAPEPESERAAIVAALASGLGFHRAFSLPEWP